jgi:hypothetical protein
MDGLLVLLTAAMRVWSHTSAGRHRYFGVRLELVIENTSNQEQSGRPAGSKIPLREERGFHAMLEEHLDVPFKTEVLSVEVTVEKVDLTDDDQIVVVCTRGKSRQSIPIVDLPFPSPPPKGAEWIDAYRRWACGK